MKDFEKTTALVMVGIGLMASIAAAQSSGGGMAGGSAGFSTSGGDNAGGNPAGAPNGTSLNTNANVNTGFNTGITGRTTGGPGPHTMANSNNTATMGASTASSAGVRGILPAGRSRYTYYPSANVYYAPGSKTYYYMGDNGWASGTSAPSGVTLGSSRIVTLSGMAKSK